MTRTLLWFRDDLRVEDHPALTFAVHAASDDGDVVGLYVLDDETPGIRPLGGAARWWLHHALLSLADRLRDLGIPLLIRCGPAAQQVPDVVQATGSTGVVWTRRYGGPERETDASMKEDLRGRWITAHSFPGSLLQEPWTISTGGGGPYRVFTPFYKNLSGHPLRELLPVPKPVAEYSGVQSSLAGAGVSLGAVDDLDLLPTRPDWAGGLRDRWTPTEEGGQQRLREFVQQEGDTYTRARDVPGVQGTSLLSPYLRFGQVSPLSAWTAASELDHEPSASTFRSELGWREFCWHLLYHFPDLPEKNLRTQFDAYPWRTQAQEPDVFRAWSAGETGFPFVDAGMRELWQTGHMHNRVRMAAASLLVKNFGIHWREGEAWFWDTLVDADAASNPANWQWVAGSGADAAPFFRIFNPERQRDRFDPDDVYVRRWVPEFGSEDYPDPLVDLRASRQQALAEYQQLSGGSG